MLPVAVGSRSRARSGEVAGQRAGHPVCVSEPSGGSRGSVLLAWTSRWHGTKAGSKVAETSTETQADRHTHTQSPLRGALTLGLLPHALQRSWVVEGAPAESAPARDADGFICRWRPQRRGCCLASQPHRRDGCWDGSPPSHPAVNAGGCKHSRVAAATTCRYRDLHTSSCCLPCAQGS